ncbi:MAG: hypothetical protein ABH847_02015 [Candidatus Omnitrophota bacterium]
MIRKAVLLLVFIFLLIDTSFAVEKPQLYMPYPIVFVSGIGTNEEANKNLKGSPSHEWPKTRIFNELKKYFQEDPKDLTTRRYEYEGNLDLGEVSHLEFFFYKAQQATLATNADLLQRQIEKILNPKEGGYYKPDSYTYTEPCDTPKVILVCHSYGGLIARKMLVANKENIRDKVAAVFFLGVPQEGSPISVIGYFLPKEIPYLMEDIRNIDDILRKEDFTDRLWDEINFKILRNYERQKLIGNLKFIKWAESQEGLYTSVRDIFDNAAIENAIASDYQFLALYRKIPPVYQKGVVWATLIPDAQANTYRKKFELHNSSNPDKPFVRYIPRDDDLSYDLSDSVLSTLGTDIGVEKVHAIVGTKDDAIREYLCAKADGYMFGHFDRLDYSCVKNGLWNDGDGVISLASQKAIPGVESPNTHVIDAAHVSFLSPILLTGETDHPATPNIIIQAIDDKPVIESAYFAGGYPTSYIVIKVKDYLLADIEIAEMRVDGQAVDLNEFNDPLTGTFKPYVKFKKDFLKERTVTLSNQKIRLSPGEFYVPLPYLSYSDAHTIYFKLKNPALKEVEAALYLPGERTITKGGYAQVIAGSHAAKKEDWSVIREYAYNDFFSSPQDIVNGAFGVGRSGSIYGADCSYSYPPPYTWYWVAWMEMTYSSWLNFDLNLSTKKITSAKFTYNFYKDFEGTSQGFDVIISRDSSNTWPPTITSSADTLIFSLNTADLPDGGQPKVDLQRIIDIPLEKLNSFGYNIWQIRPNPAFPEDNCIPEPVFYGDYGYANFSQTMRIYYYPSLFVTFEEKH